MDQKICLVMPVYNEAECLKRVLNEWCNTFKFLKIDYTILVANDGSSDGTAEILDKFAADNSNIIAFHQNNSGHGKSIMNLYHQAIRQDADWIMQIDSDDQVSSSEFKILWDRRNDTNFILGYRQIRMDPTHRKIISWSLRSFLKIFFGVPIADSNIPFRLMNKSLLHQMLPLLPPELFAPNIFLAVLAARHGEQLLHIPVMHKRRITGRVSI